MEDFNKVFGIGLSRTGTRSLNEALTILGIPSIHWPTDVGTYSSLSNSSYELPLFNRYRGLTDITAASFYPQFDETHPNSKFILTTRDLDDWARKMLDHFWIRRGTRSPGFVRQYMDRFWMLSRKQGGLLKFLFARRFLKYLRSEPGIVNRMEFQMIAMYGGIRFSSDERLRYVFQRHHDNVLDYFAQRPEDLLVFNVFDGDGWEKLCHFLNCPVPDAPYPALGDRKAD